MVRREEFRAAPDDRGFEVGDMLCLREWEPVSKVYTGRELYAWVSYRLGAQEAPEGGGLTAGFVVLGIRLQSAWEAAVPLGG